MVLFVIICVLFFAHSPSQPARGTQFGQVDYFTCTSSCALLANLADLDCGFNCGVRIECRDGLAKAERQPQHAEGAAVERDACCSGGLHRGFHRGRRSRSLATAGAVQRQVRRTGSGGEHLFGISDIIIFGVICISY